MTHHARPHRPRRATRPATRTRPDEFELRLLAQARAVHEAIRDEEEQL